jgi:hypothetical protein
VIDRERLYRRLAATVGWLALALQYYLALRLASRDGASLATATLNFFSYFTVLINLAAAIAMTGGWYRTPSIGAPIAGYIAIVGIVYSLVLRTLWDPTGAHLVADVALHDVMPILYIAGWVMFAAHGTLTWRAPARWLVAPLLYCVYAVARGLATGWWAYPFIDVASLGPLTVLRNVVILAVAFWGMGLCAVALDRRLGRRQ